MLDVLRCFPTVVRFQLIHFGSFAFQNVPFPRSSLLPVLVQLKILRAASLKLVLAKMHVYAEKSWSVFGVHRESMVTSENCIHCIAFIDIEQWTFCFLRERNPPPQKKRKKKKKRTVTNENLHTHVCDGPLVAAPATPHSGSFVWNTFESEKAEPDGPKKRNAMCPVGKYFLPVNLTKNRFVSSVCVFFLCVCVCFVFVYRTAKCQSILFLLAQLMQRAIEILPTVKCSMRPSSRSSAGADDFQLH